MHHKQRHQGENPTFTPSPAAADRPGAPKLSRLDRAVAGMQAEIVSEAEKSYSTRMIQHSLFPHNPVPMENADGHASLTGPCSDTIDIYLRGEGDTITEAHFTTDGCSASTAAGSMAATLAEGKDIYDARQISGDDVDEALDGLPDDHTHCAALAANALGAAVDDLLARRNEP